MRILNEFVAKNIDKVRKFYDSILKDNPKQSKLKRKPVTTDYTMTIMRYLSTNIERIKTMVKAAEFGEITTQKLNLYIEFVQEEEKEKEKKKASIIKNNIKILGRVKSSLPKIDEESNLENSMDHVSEGSEDLNKSVDSEKLEEGESFKKLWNKIKKKSTTNEEKLKRCYSNWDNVKVLEWLAVLEIPDLRHIF